MSIPSLILTCPASKTNSFFLHDRIAVLFDTASRYPVRLVMSPPLLVGVDVGMTCTGVCYYLESTTAEARMIQKWPGRGATSSDKVPTAVCYQNGNPVAWGFSCDHEDLQAPGVELREWFKVALDESEYRAQKAKGREYVLDSHQHVKEAYRDFLRALYRHIGQSIGDTTLLGKTAWQNAENEFLFTVPTTWTALGITNTFKSLISEAGFGNGPKHSISIGLTEAEAAAVHTFATTQNMYISGNVILVVDAGGGTTDLALLKVNGDDLEQLDVDRGDEIGSVEIDIDFQDMAMDRLRKVASKLRWNEDKIVSAAKGMTTAFRTTKENFGSDISDRHAGKRIDVPGMANDVHIPEADITRGGMFFTKEDIKGLFDTRLRKMFKLIDFQMDKMQKVAPYEQITYLVLSGGLGSSDYVYKELRERYLMDPHRYAKSMIILRSPEPQAAPVRGLIADRRKKIKTGKGAITIRKSRMSLGIICYEKYNAKQHTLKDLVKDNIDGKDYAKDQIHWLIRKGDIVTDEALPHPFYRTLKKTDECRWVSKIVKSDLEKPPTNMKEHGVTQICRMQSDLSGVGFEKFKKEKKHVWQVGKLPSHYLAEYQIKFQIKPAAIETELWFNGQRYNKPNSFSVEWEESAHVPTPKEHLGEASEYQDWDKRL